MPSRARAESSRAYLIRFAIFRASKNHHSHLTFLQPIHLTFSAPTPVHVYERLLFKFALASFQAISGRFRVVHLPNPRGLVINPRSHNLRAFSSSPYSRKRQRPGQETEGLEGLEELPSDWDLADREKDSQEETQDSGEADLGGSSKDREGQSYEQGWRRVALPRDLVYSVYPTHGSLDKDTDKDISKGNDLIPGESRKGDESDKKQSRLEQSQSTSAPSTFLEALSQLLGRQATPTVATPTPQKVAVGKEAREEGPARLFWTPAHPEAEIEKAAPRGGYFDSYQIELPQPYANQQLSDSKVCYAFTHPSGRKFLHRQDKRVGWIQRLQHIKDWKSHRAQTARGVAGMKSWFQFLAVPTVDTPGTCILLHFDNKRYLFGRIGEGTMRANNELGQSLRKLHEIFITGKTGSESTGGLLGTILTIAEASAHAQSNTTFQHASSGLTKEQAAVLTIHGPPNLMQSIAAARKFIFRKWMPMNFIEVHDPIPPSPKVHDWIPCFIDENVKVFSIAVLPKGAPMHKTVERTQREETANDAARRHILGDMFNSKWKLDTLVELKLSEVKLPAKIWVREVAKSDLVEYRGPLPGGSVPVPDPNLLVYVRTPWPSALVTGLPPTEPRDECISYIISGHTRRGKFDANKAKELKVPKGPLFGKLANGHTIDIEGRTITPEDVLGPSIIGAGFAILDIPTIEYVEPLINCEQLSAQEIMAGVSTFIWILGPGVSSSEALQKFMHNRKDVYHFVASPDHSANRLALHGAAEGAIKLASVDMTHFPIPNHDNTVVPQLDFRRLCGTMPALMPSQRELFTSSNIKQAERGLTVQIDPHFMIQSEHTIPLLQTEHLITTPEAQKVMQLALEAKTAFATGPAKLDMEAWQAKIPVKEAEVITLGTGSSAPSRNRNVSANLVRIPGYGSYLLDAGEGTMGQLQRVFNPQEMLEVLRDLRMIWISHGHADHHLGTVSVIKAWYNVVHGKNTETPPITRDVLLDLQKTSLKSSQWRTTTAGWKGTKYLTVLGDTNMLRYLAEFSSVEDFGYSHVLPLFPSSKSSEHETELLRTALRGDPRQPDNMDISHPMQKYLLGIKRLKTIQVHHCHGARAIAITMPRKPEERHLLPFKFAYSGDCRPSTGFARIARNATVMIHEATFEDELSGEARAKKHSTVAEAIGVATLAKSRALVLTHFSQRYQKIPVLDDIWKRKNALISAIQKEEQRVVVQQGMDTGDDADEIAPPDELEAAAGQDVEDANDDIEDADASEAEEDVDVPGSADIPMKIAVAFDYMRIKIGDMPRMEALRPVLQSLFATEIEETLVRTQKRMLRDADEISLSDSKKRKPTPPERNSPKGANGKRTIIQTIKDKVQKK